MISVLNIDNLVTTIFILMGFFHILLFDECIYNKKGLWNMYAHLNLNVTVTLTFDLETQNSIGVIY